MLNLLRHDFMLLFTSTTMFQQYLCSQLAASLQPPTDADKWLWQVSCTDTSSFIVLDIDVHALFVVI